MTYYGSHAIRRGQHNWDWMNDCTFSYDGDGDPFELADKPLVQSDRNYTKYYNVRSKR